MSAARREAHSGGEGGRGSWFSPGNLFGALAWGKTALEGKWVCVPGSGEYKLGKQNRQESTPGVQTLVSVTFRSRGVTYVVLCT